MTKVDIYSGFLGAGKTTLIKKLIKEAYSGERVVLIENEFGEIGIDGGFLRDAGIEITEMNSGCICCSLVGDFTEALKKVETELSPDRIIIEPSGVGKLSDVIRAVKQTDSDTLEINCLAVIVDANKCKMYMKNFGEFFNDQIEHASSIILSHVDVAKPGRAEEAISLIKEHNAGAVIISTALDKLNGADILSAMENKDTIGEALKLLEKEHKHIIEYSLKLDSNPEFTASVIVAYARAAFRMAKRGAFGCKTVLDVAPADISAQSPAELRRTLL